MEKYIDNPRDTMGNNVFCGCMNEEFVKFQTDASLPFFATQIGITHPDENYYIKRTKSNAFTLEYVCSGNGFLQVDGASFELEAGDIYLLLPGKKHSYGAKKNNPYEKIWINFSSDMFISIVYSLSLDDKIVFKKADRLRPYFENLLKIASEKQNDELVQTEISKVVFSIIADLSSMSTTEIPGSEFDKRAYRILSRAYNNTKIKDLADRLCVSEVYLINRFKRTYGITPYQFLLSRKIEAAKSLLSSTNLNVKQISVQLSFQNEHYFSDVFKRKTGFTPSEYRILNEHRR